MPRKHEMSDEDVWRYYRSYKMARESLVDSIEKLRMRNLQSTSPSERADNDARILELQADKAHLDAQRLAFEAGRQAITPPSDEQLDRIRGLIDAVEALNAEQQITDEIIELAQVSVATFNEIHPNQG